LNRRHVARRVFADNPGPRFPLVHRFDLPTVETVFTRAGLPGCAADTHLVT